jgi:hypothetical protein
MPDEGSTMAPGDLRVLLALVDGSLPADERTAAEARLTATPEGRRALAAHRRVAGALRGRGPMAPEELRQRIATRAERREPASPRRGRLALAGGLAAVVLALALALPGLLAGSPSVADAVSLAALPATEATPPTAQPGLLARTVDGVEFPEWGEKFGWHAHGARSDELHGRDAETVFYDHQGHHIGYTIVSGPPLEIPDRAHRSRVNGVTLAAYRDGMRDVVVFERGGHTCVLAGHVLHAATLVKLATWKADGAVRF